MENESSFKKSLLWNAAGNIVYLLSQWLVTVLVTVIGGLTDAGVLSVAMSVSATFQTFAMFGIRSFQVSDLEGKYTDTCYAGLRAVTCAAAMLVCILFSLINGYFGGQLLAIFLFMLFRLAESYSDVLHGIAQRRERLDIAGKAFSVKGIGILVCFLAGYLATRQLNIALLFMALFSCASTLLYDLPAVRRISDLRFAVPPAPCRALARETLPLCVYLFLFTAISTVPKLILEKQCGEEVLGAYSSIFAPAMLLQAATGYLYNPFAAGFANARNEKNSRAFVGLLLKISLVITGISAAALLAGSLVGEFALVLVFGEQIRAYAGLLIPILAVNAVISLLGFLSMVAVVLRRFRWLLAGYAVGFLLSLCLTAPAIRLFGANGTSYALTAAAGTVIAVLCVCIGRAVRVEMRADGNE